MSLYYNTPHLILTRFKTDARAELKNNDNYSLGRIKSGFLRRSASPQYIPRHQTTEKQRVKNILYSEGKIRIALSYIFTSWRLENCQGFKCWAIRTSYFICHRTFRYNQFKTFDIQQSFILLLIKIVYKNFITTWILFPIHLIWSMPIRSTRLLNKKPSSTPSTTVF